MRALKAFETDRLSGWTPEKKMVTLAWAIGARRDAMETAFLICPWSKMVWLR